MVKITRTFTIDDNHARGRMKAPPLEADLAFQTPRKVPKIKNMGALKYSGKHTMPMPDHIIYIKLEFLKVD